MSRAPSGLALLGMFVCLSTACDVRPPVPLAPSVVEAGGATRRAVDAAELWGVTGNNRTAGATQISGFTCALGPFGIAEQSHFVIAASGNESLVCSGLATAPAPAQTLVLSDFPCVLPSGTVTVRSQFVFAPSGQATLTCQAR